MFKVNMAGYFVIIKELVYVSDYNCFLLQKERSFHKEYECMKKIDELFGHNAELERKSK